MISTFSGARIVRSSLKYLALVLIDSPRHENINVFVRLLSAGSVCLRGLQYLPFLES